MYNLTLFASLAAIFLYALGFATLWRAAKSNLRLDRGRLGRTHRDAPDHSTAAPIPSTRLGSLGSSLAMALPASSTYRGRRPVAEPYWCQQFGCCRHGAVVAVSSTKLPVNNIFLLLFPISIFNLLCLNLIDPGKIAPLDLSTAQVAHILTLHICLHRANDRGATVNTSCRARKPPQTPKQRSLWSAAGARNHGTSTSVHVVDWSSDY